MRGANKYVIVLISAVFAIGAIFAGMIYSKAKLPKEDAAAETSTSSNEETTKVVTIEDLFYDSTHVFLAEKVSDDLIENVKESVSDDQGQLNLLNNAITKWNVQKRLNVLFEEPVLKGNKVNEKAKEVATVTQADKDLVLTEVIASGINDGFALAVQSVLGRTATSGSAGAGTADVQEAQRKLQVVVNEGQVVEGFSLEGYIAARDAINRLTDGTEKTKLLAGLKLVEDVLVSMGYNLSAI